MARENLELLAASCQSRVDAFYSELARHQGDGAHRYYAEKTRPGPTARLVSELYPGGREIVLVRDFRDMVSSILAFNAKRGVTLWGYDAAMSEAQWLSHMRAEAAKVLDGWRERSDRVHLVRYEELLADPAATLTGIFTYLGLDADRDTIRTAIEQAVVKFPEAQAAHRTSSSFEASVGRWKRDLTPEQQAACAAAFDDLLTEFGYEATDVASAEIPSPDEAGARVSSSL